MLTIQSLIQNAKQLSKSYEKNAVNAEGVIQQIATLEAACAESAKSPEQREAKADRRALAARSRPPMVTTDPKVMIASLDGQHAADQAAAILARKISNATALSASSSQPARSHVMHAIQRESSQVRSLKRENIILKQQLHEYQFALELIMSKYRSQMLELLHQAEDCCKSVLSQHESPERLEQQAKTIYLSNRLQDMKNRFENYIAPASEGKIEEQQQLIQELVLEHDTLVELYQIAKKYGSLPAQLANKVEEAEIAIEAMGNYHKENDDPEGDKKGEEEEEVEVNQDKKPEEDPKMEEENENTQEEEEEEEVPITEPMDS